MSFTNLIIRGVVGGLIVAFLVCIVVFGAGTVTRMFSDGRVSQIEDTDFANIDCANIKTSKGHRLNSEECNKARARKDLDRVRLFLYDSNDAITNILSAARTVIARNIFVVLIGLMIVLVAVYYNFGALYAFACALAGVRAPLNMLAVPSEQAFTPKKRQLDAMYPTEYKTCDIPNIPLSLKIE